MSFNFVEGNENTTSPLFRHLTVIATIRFHSNNEIIDLFEVISRTDRYKTHIIALSR